LLGFSTNASETITRRNLSEALNGTTTGNPKDVPLSVLITGGKSTLGGDSDSQTAILDEDGILVRSEINVDEEFGHKGRAV
jgi:hypothetical protein